MFAETKIDGWESIQRFFSALSKSHSQWIFRGHTNADWLLDTSLQRSAHIYEISPQSLTVIERIMLDRFKRTAHHFLRYSPNDEDDIEWLSIFQHHGGITRLLDFTRSFYVALFFALDFSSTDACVWCVSKRRLEDRAIEVLEPGNYGKINFKRDITYNEGRETAQLFVGHYIGTSVVIPVIPYRLNERMSIQQGIFLFPTNLCASLEDNLYSMFDVHSMDFKPPASRGAVPGPPGDHQRAGLLDLWEYRLGRPRPDFVAPGKGPAWLGGGGAGVAAVSAFI